MKNLKKVLAVVLAFAMIIGTNAFAASFSDLDKTANYAEAVSVLADLGILKGYEDGTVKPEGDITRAEFAAVVCRIKGLEDAANSAKGNTMFTDVAADSWASGYINMASQQGIINGVGGNLFLPDENVKFEEAVKMVVAALGYSPKAEGMGGYPTGYLAVASQINVTKGVSGANGVAANRGTVARLAYNALDVPLMEQVSYGTGSVQYEPGDRILLDSLDLIKVEATIDRIPGSTGSSTDLKSDEVRLTIKKHYIAYDGKLMISDPSVSNTYSDLSWYEGKVNVGTTDAQSFLNKTVIAYLQGAYDDDVVIKAIVEKTGRNEEVNFQSEDIYPKYTDMDKPEVAFYDDAESSSSYTRATIDPTEFVLYVNDINYDQGATNIKEIMGGVIDTSKDALGVFADLIAAAQEDDPLGFNVKLLNNDTDSEYDVAYVEYFTDVVVNVVNANTKRITSKNNVRPFFLDDTERNASFTIEKADGTAASFDDIKEDTVLSIRKGIVEAEKLITGKVIIVDNNVTGKITEISDSDKEITVADKAYRVETYGPYGVEFDKLKTNTEATFYVNMRGNIFYLDKSAIVSNMKLGFATIIGSEGGMSSGQRIKLMNENGEFVIYDFANKVTINDRDTSVTSETYDFAKEKVVDWTEFEANEPTIPNDAAEHAGKKLLVERQIKDKAETDGVYVLNAPVAYDLNSENKVYKLNLTARSNKGLDDDGYGFTGARVQGTYNVNTEAAGSVYFSDKTILFSIDLVGENKKAMDQGATWSTLSTVNENDISVMKRDALIDDQPVKAYAFNCDTDGYAKAVMGSGLVNALVADSNLMVITGVATTTNADGDNVTRLTGLVNGEEIEVYVGDDTEKSATAQAGASNRFVRGDVVVYQSGADELKAIAKVFSVANQFGAGDVITAAADKDITDTIIHANPVDPEAKTVLDPALDGDEVKFYFGYARDVKNTVLKIVTSDPSSDLLDVSFRSANIVEYDKFEGKDPKISATDLSAVDADQESDTDFIGDFVFVRTIDGVGTDAVIIKAK